MRIGLLSMITISMGCPIPTKKQTILILTMRPTLVPIQIRTARATFPVLAGTDPRNRNSVLRVKSIARSGSNWIVSFDAIAGKLYRLEYKTSLSDANWLMLSDLNPNISGPVQMTDFSPVGSQRLYRIRVVLP